MVILRFNLNNDMIGISSIDTPQKAIVGKTADYDYSVLFASALRFLARSNYEPVSMFVQRAPEFVYEYQGNQSASVTLKNSAQVSVWYSDMPGNCISAYQKY